MALIVWLFFAAAAVRVLREKGAPIAHSFTIFLAPFGYRPGFRALAYLLLGRYRSTELETLPSSVDAARRYGLLIVAIWFFVVGIVVLLWFARAL